MAIILLLAAGCADITPMHTKKKGGPPGAKSAVIRDSQDSLFGEAAKPAAPEACPPDYEFQPPLSKSRLSFKEETPIHFVSAGRNRAEWTALQGYWNEVTEMASDPLTGQQVERKAVKIRVPLGLTQEPTVPAENPLTVAKFALGKQLFFDGILSSSGSVSCASCHDPSKGFTDQLAVSKGIRGQLGFAGTPTLVNAAYNQLHGWDGRAASLEEQVQEHVENASVLFDGAGNAWKRAIDRLRAKPDYAAEFDKVFGHAPTRDAVAKAIASYVRVLLSGNAIGDRVALGDFDAALKDAFTRKDTYSLSALGLDVEKDAGKAGDVAKSLKAGRELFLGKARCSQCHSGENFTDQQFHNIGIGVKDGKLLPGDEGRYARLPLGRKNVELTGAFKTPTLRGLVTTAPYFRDGSAATLEDVVNYYDRGGNAHPHLDARLRDTSAERVYAADPAAHKGTPPTVFTADGRAIIPLPLKLSEQEKKDLVLFLRSLQGDAVDAKVSAN
jgi:cytochrome c peroxidase